jgi:phage baseplate assembly protein W
LSNVADDASLLTDVALELRFAQLRPVYGAKTERRTIAVAQGPRTIVDLATTAGRPNLGQAIAMRLLTPRGELTELGHPEYGSRLHELIGVPNTETRRSLAKLFVLESLAQEPRIEKVVRCDVIPAPGSRDRVDVQLEVKPVAFAETVAVGPFTLSFAP